jgi:Pyruvate/2-oxoacid:ferredoxin oxidoreductase gamma subunit
VIDAYKVARKTGMGVRINTIMQTCFFAISGVLPREEAIAKIKNAIKKTYGKRGEAVVQQNFAAVDQALAQSARGEGAGRGDQHDRDAAAGARTRRPSLCRR